MCGTDTCVTYMQNPIMKTDTCSLFGINFTAGIGTYVWAVNMHPGTLPDHPIEEVQGT